MADYRRMVSYMYQYENGVKRKNVGFARVEARGGQCKITLHMQLLGQLDSIFPTYLIQRGNNNLELIYLGDAILKSQIMDSRLMADENNVMGSGYALSDMGGLLLFLNDKVFFATEWDDKPVVAKEVLEALKPKQASPKEQNKPANFRDEAEAAMAKPQEVKPEEQMNIPSYMLPGGWKMVERRQTDNQNRDNHGRVNQFDTMQKEIDNKAGNYAEDLFDKGRAAAGQAGESQSKSKWFIADHMDEVLKEANTDQSEYDKGDHPFRENSFEPFRDWNKPEQAGALQNQGSGAEAVRAGVFRGEGNEAEAIQAGAFRGEENKIEAEQAGAFRGEENQIQDNTPQNMEIQDSLESEEYQVENMNNEESHEESIEIENPDNLFRTIEEMNAAEEPDSKEAKHFFDNYPRIYPFEDNEVILCVKIEPKDLGLLPKEIWPYSNNSFLMHGYYCYHHLIFAKMKNRYGFRYVLGVPGIYHGREQFMARMFGFENFKSIRKRDLKQGDFGYWYLPVYL